MNRRERTGPPPGSDWGDTDWGEPEPEEVIGYSPLRPDAQVMRVTRMRADYFEPMTQKEVEAELEAQIELAIRAKADLISFVRGKDDPAALARIEATDVEEFLSARGKAMIQRMSGSVPKPLVTVDIGKSHPMGR